MRIVCSALNCKYSSEDEDSSSVIFINFPNDDTAKAWAEKCGRSDLVEKSNAELHLNYYICSHHIEDRCYISKNIPVIIEQGAVPTLFGTSSRTDSEDSINIFDKPQHLQEAGDNVSLTYCNMNIETNEYHSLTIRFSDLCRICGEVVLDGVDIFAAKSIELKLTEKINLHMPISIDTDDSMPQKLCSECCSKLEITHLLAISCLKTDIKLKKLLNVEKHLEYESKYNALVEKCLLEADAEICMDNNTNPDTASFAMNKMANPDLETSLEELENEESPEAQNINFQCIDKGFMQSEISTIGQTYKECNSKDNSNCAVKEISQVEQDKIRNSKRDISCSQCQNFYETQEIFENHKIFCIKKKDTSEYITMSNMLQGKKDIDVVVNTELEIESSHTGNEKLESEQTIDKPEISESEQLLHCTICSELFKTQQDFDKHSHKNLAENDTIGVRKRCGHCKEMYYNKKDLLNHIMQLHGGKLLVRCFTCDKTYEKWSSLDIHEATHRLDKPYLCDLCGKSFKHSNYLRGHKRIHLDESKKKRHVCEVCKKAFRSRFHLREHKNQHEGNKPYTCEQCGKAFYRRIQLRQHKLSHGVNKYMCSICNATFNRRGNMNSHVKRHSNEDGMYTCSVCAHKCKSMSELKTHRKNHTEEEIVDSIKKKSSDKEIWRCNVCNKVFSKRNVLKQHEQTHERDKIYVECDECNKKLANKNSLMYHKKSVHQKEKPHMCQYCGKSFISKEARLTHERIHTGECPYVCKVCNVRYRCSNNLNQHMRTHTGLKPYTCNYCNKRFARKGTLTVHERTHTGVKPYPCEICGRCFSQKNDMMKHVKTHRCKSLQCDRCNDVFKRKKDLLKHTAVHDTSAILNYVDTCPSTLRQYDSSLRLNIGST
ncbi:PREDICTED: zinc finger protein 84-like isoform X1 [Dinoponera quadriceps]|uniref:Zinc finger protein 84-like isoform X1 n=1 Tax=Dinoponera quadriceps TaxID=609295 RepID=A0A6P3XA71_DINQU|nr:PREDICTED: zinc finger protein 84-like isoform X1 [Dinoponera quadriceps]